MKNKFLICALLFMLTGCANSRENAPAQPPTDISAALSETTEPPPETADDTYEAPNDLAIAAREAFIEHFRREGYLRLPANYQGAYFDEGDFVVQISDDDHSEYDFLYELDCARVETVKYTRKELEALRDIPWNILKDEHGIDVVSNFIDHKNNAIGIDIFDRYTDEEKAEISSYVEDYPVVINYTDSYPVLD